MTRSNLVLFGGIAAVVAGASSFCANALFSLLLLSNEVIPWPISPLLTLVEIITAFLYVLGLVGLYASLHRRSRLGISGLVLASLAFVTTLLPWAFGIAYALYEEALVPGDTIVSSVTVFPQLIVGLTGDALLAGAVLLLAVAAARARVLGRWTFLPFVVAFAYVLPHLYWVAYTLGFEGLFWLPASPALLRGPFWVLLGGLLWWRALGSGSNVAADVRAHGRGAGRA